MKAGRRTQGCVDSKSGGLDRVLERQRFSKVGIREVQMGNNAG